LKGKENSDFPPLQGEGEGGGKEGRVTRIRWKGE